MDKYTVITGASSGIGKSFAEYYGKTNNLILISRRIEKLKVIADCLKSEYNCKIMIIDADLTSDNDLIRIKDQTKNLIIDNLILCAGIGNPGNFLDKRYDEHSELINTNLLSFTDLLYFFAQKMRLEGNGNIVVISSLLGIVPAPYNSLYAATKIYIKSLCESLSYEFSEYGIKVLIVCPGTVNTSFNRVMKAESGIIVRQPSQIVETAVKSLGKKILVIDGLINKIIYFLSKFIPAKLMVSISGFIIKKRLKNEGI